MEPARLGLAPPVVGLGGWALLLTLGLTWLKSGYWKLWALRRGRGRGRGWGQEGRCRGPWGGCCAGRCGDTKGRNLGRSRRAPPRGNGGRGGRGGRGAGPAP